MGDQISSNLETIKKHIRPILYRNSVTLPNSIFAAVTLLLIVFGEIQEGLFMFSIVMVNSVVGTVQDLRAKVALERLQILMTPKVKRVLGSGETETVLLKDLRLHDEVKVELGDQIPADGVIRTSNSAEVNEALLTGESNNIGKKVGDKVLAGSFIIAGSATIAISALPEESFVSKMTSRLKEYQQNLSPIQQTLGLFVQYMTYVLIAGILYVLVAGITAHELVIFIIKDIAALTGTLVPQGLVLATTVFFAYGAVRMFKKQVLLQEINAIEKLGRIKNLCVDKTGTLTENLPTLEKIITNQPWTEDLANTLILGYFTATSDASHTAQAIEKHITASFGGTILHSIPFSSGRKFGSATIQLGETEHVTVVGAPDILLTHIRNEEQKRWTEELVTTLSKQAKRLLLLTVSRGPVDEHLTNCSLEPIALYVLENPLRSGTEEIIQYFQNRGVSIRVISGDNAGTAQAIAKTAGVKHTDLVITGPEIDLWDDEAYRERVPAYHVFARIKPEQKEQIINTLKRTGFTAMVGDGANDALALKTADLGIAMFDGAGATRSVAQVVLMNNSFGSLPSGVNLADSIITNIELVASVFFNKVTIGLLLFISLAALGYNYPVSTRNITLISYCTIGLPIFYWAVWPAKSFSDAQSRSFLRKILPYSVIQGTLTTIGTIAVFSMSLEHIHSETSNILVVLSLIAFGFAFFIMAPGAYGTNSSVSQKKNVYTLTAIVLAIILIPYSSPFLRKFFELAKPPLLQLLYTGLIVAGTIFLQYQVTIRWFQKPKPTPTN
ncbi:MAG: HAD-IC family P-type ATPase [Candidatus Doudnabacteria bacterium]|nr:HAD-IC family P-type ATPase [Candidatus Doudnabacteria bacterium]